MAGTYKGLVICGAAQGHQVVVEFMNRAKRKPDDLYDFLVYPEALHRLANWDSFHFPAISDSAKLYMEAHGYRSGIIKYPHGCIRHQELAQQAAMVLEQVIGATLPGVQFVAEETWGGKRPNHPKKSLSVCCGDGAVWTRCIAWLNSRELELPLYDYDLLFMPGGGHNIGGARYSRGWAVRDAVRALQVPEIVLFGHEQCKGCGEISGDDQAFHARNSHEIEGYIKTQLELDVRKIHHRYIPLEGPPVEYASSVIPESIAA